jgi:hypothetical protein
MLRLSMSKSANDVEKYTNSEKKDPVNKNKNEKRAKVFKNDHIRVLVIFSQT